MDDSTLHVKRQNSQAAFGPFCKKYYTQNTGGFLFLTLTMNKAINSTEDTNTVIYNSYIVTLIKMTY